MEIRRAVWVTLALFALCPQAKAQVVQGNVVSAGFPSRTGTATIREGQWFPIIVDLQASGEHFQGQLRVQSIDLDGDLITYVEEPVVVTANEPKRVWCYAVDFAGVFGSMNALTVDVVSEAGELVTKIPVPDRSILPPDAMLMLNLSAVSPPVLTILEGMQLNPENPGTSRLYRPVEIVRVVPEDLPDRGWGLEAVQTIVWDQPDPGRLSIAQTEALIDWVRNGGRLVVGIGASWPGLQNSPLAEILPYAPGGSTTSIANLPGFAREFAAANAGSLFRNPIPIPDTRVRPDAAVLIRDNNPDGRPLDLAAAWTVGSGRVIAVAASLADLRLPNSAFVYRLFDVNQKSSEYAKSENSAQMMLVTPTRLYADLISPTQFTRRGSLFAGAALGFVVAYILLSTVASWYWLGRHNRKQLSWTVFAVFAVVASVLSIGTVRLTRGISENVRSVSLIDLSAGESKAQAACWFGYRSPTRQRPELSLPGKGNYLRALARPPEAREYATPERYAAVTGKALLRDTPMRATLKQFEGFWRGEIDGTVRGRVEINRQTGEVTETSWLQNDLPTEIVGGYLLYIDPRGSDAAARPFGRTGSDRPKFRNMTVAPAVHVLALPVPGLKSGAQVTDFGRKTYDKVHEARLKFTPPRDDNLREMPDLPTLWYEQSVWSGLGSLGGLVSVSAFDRCSLAAMLLSTRDLYLPSDNEFKSVRVGGLITGDGLVDRDITSWLLPGQGILLLVADDAGPVRLHHDGEPVESESGRSVYRVRIPLSYK